MKENNTQVKYLVKVVEVVMEKNIIHKVVGWLVFIVEIYLMVVSMTNKDICNFIANFILTCGSVFSALIESKNNEDEIITFGFIGILITLVEAITIFTKNTILSGMIVIGYIISVASVLTSNFGMDGYADDAIMIIVGTLIWVYAVKLDYGLLFTTGFIGLRIIYLITGEFVIRRKEKAVE